MTASQASCCSSRFKALSWSGGRPKVASVRGNGQPDGTPAINHRKMTIGRQDLDMLHGMAPIVEEERMLIFYPGRLAGDDLLAQCEHGLPHRHGQHHILAQILVHGADHVVHVLKIEFMLFAEIRHRRGVVVDLEAVAPIFERIGRIVGVVRQPEFLHGDPDIRVVLVGELGELFNSLVGEINVGHGQDVHFPGDQGRLVLVRRVRHVPMHDERVTADVGNAGDLVALDAGRLGHIGQHGRDPHMEAVPDGKDPLPCRDGLVASRAPDKNRHQHQAICEKSSFYIIGLIHLTPIIPLTDLVFLA